MNESQSANPSQGCFCQGAGPQVSDLMSKLVPAETREHIRNCRVEFLKALRSLIDQRIEHLTRSEKKGATVSVE
ncbi:MAG: hypothetical protein HYR60_33585 [Acidobacteria bacterium]|nr:hypothetical protein [Acidobacteriota bacterium]MBI3469743.1 hypothetical protein [Candidatus Solibacter usitatus]